MRCTVFIVAGFLLASTATPSRSEAKGLESADGYYWLSLEDESSKHLFIAGFLLGSFSVLKEFDDFICVKESNRTELRMTKEANARHSLPKFEKQEAAQGFIDGFCYSLSRINQRELYGLTNSSVAEGLDSFYGDFRNKGILIKDAVYLVKAQIKGTPTEDIDKILLYLRSGEVKHLEIRDEKGKLIRKILFP